MKNIRVFLSENFPTLEMKFSIHLNRRVFVMLQLLRSLSLDDMYPSLDALHTSHTKLKVRHNWAIVWLHLSDRTWSKCEQMALPITVKMSQSIHLWLNSVSITLALALLLYSSECLCLVDTIDCICICYRYVRHPSSSTLSI